MPVQAASLGDVLVEGHEPRRPSGSRIRSAQPWSLMTAARAVKSSAGAEADMGEHLRDAPVRGQIARPFLFRGPARALREDLPPQLVRDPNPLGRAEAALALAPI